MNVIAYMRVSTSKQGIGLDAQRAIIANWAAVGGHKVVAEYSEKESGKETLNRPALQAAIAQAVADGAVLVVAKLDRLSRDVADIFTLKKRKNLSFEVCDMNASDTMMLGVMAALAQKEREMISTRTKQALAALKEQGKQLGNPNAADHMRAINHMGAARRREQANQSQANRHAWNAIRFMGGSLQAKADFLNSEGYTTPRGGRYTKMQVKRLIDRYTAQ